MNAVTTDPILTAHSSQQVLHQSQLSKPQPPQGFVGHVAWAGDDIPSNQMLGAAHNADGQRCYGFNNLLKT